MPELPPSARRLLAILAAIGFALRVVTIAGPGATRPCERDFPVLYAGAKLLGTGQLYSAQANWDGVHAEVGCVAEADRFIRPPFVAVLVWPFTILPYSRAFMVWWIATGLALAGFVWLWDADRLIAIALCCWSYPIASAFTAGQDVPFLLFWLALALRLVSTGRHFLAGLLLAFCAAKFHLFVLLPFWIIGKRLWSLGCGVLTGAAALVAVSFAAEGPHWGSDFLQAALDPRTNPHAWTMMNLRGLIYGFQAGAIWEAAGTAIIAGLAWYAIRSATPEYALAVALTGGLLISHHAYTGDASLLLPVALTVLSRSRLEALKWLAVAIMIPVPYLMTAFPAFRSLPQFVLVALFCGLAYEASRRWSSLPAPAGRAARFMVAE